MRSGASATPALSQPVRLPRRRPAKGCTQLLHGRAPPAQLPLERRRRLLERRLLAALPLPLGRHAAPLLLVLRRDGL